MEAGVYLRVARFEAINIVGAVSLQATLNCAAFAQAHRSSAHYDKSSFVGLAFRPPGEACVIEIYSSGRANVPGSQCFRDMLHSTYRMLPALLKYSSAAAMLQRFPPEHRNLHEEEHDAAANAPLAENRAMEWSAAHEDEDEEDDMNMGPGVFGKGTIDASLLDLLAL